MDDFTYVGTFNTPYLRYPQSLIKSDPLLPNGSVFSNKATLSMSFKRLFSKGYETVTTNEALLQLLCNGLLLAQKAAKNYAS